MTRPFRSASLVFASAACLACSSSSSPKPLGALASAIVAGQNQTVVAGVKNLPSGVVEEIVRLNGSGRLQLRRPNPWERVFLPRLAYAQTVVKGSPVPGAIVCASEGEGTLTPFSRCANTDSKGQATFFFSTDTRAGTKKSLINGVVGNEATTFDTVKATVLPDIFASSPLLTGTSWPGRTTPAEFPPEVAVDKYGNPVPYKLVVITDAYGEALKDAQGNRALNKGFSIFARTTNDSLGTAGARTVVVDSIVGPAAVNGYNVTLICGSIQIVTISGVSATGTFVTTREANQNGSRSFSLNSPADLTARPNCP